MIKITAYAAGYVDGNPTVFHLPDDATEVEINIAARKQAGGFAYIDSIQRPRTIEPVSAEYAYAMRGDNS